MQTFLFLHFGSITEESFVLGNAAANIEPSHSQKDFGNMSKRRTLVGYGQALKMEISTVRFVSKRRPTEPTSLHGKCPKMTLYQMGCVFVINVTTLPVSILTIYSLGLGKKIHRIW